VKMVPIDAPSSGKIEQGRTATLAFTATLAM
jgi:hypothetical protein